MDRIKIDNIAISQNRIEVRFSTEGSIAKYFHNENTFWCEYSIPIENTPESIAIIPFVANVLPIVWLCDAILELPSIDAQFYKCINDVKNGYKNMYPYLSFKGKVVGCECNRLIVRPLRLGGKTSESAMLFSGGVDAFSTLITHQKEKPMLITVRGADIKLNDIDGWEKVRNHTVTTAQSFDVAYTTIASNFKEFINGQVVDKELIKESGDNYWHGFQHGIGLIGLTAPLVNLIGFSKLYIASTHSYEQAERFACASDPKIDNFMRFSGVKVIHDGCVFSRQEKVDRIVAYAKGKNCYPILRVCWMHEGGDNCCQCEKCLRTIFEIYAAGGCPKDFGFNLSDKALRHSRRNMIIYGFNKNLRNIYWNDIRNTLLERASSNLPNSLGWIYTTNLKYPYIYPEIFLYQAVRQINRLRLRVYWTLRKRLS